MVVVVAAAVAEKAAAVGTADNAAADIAGDGAGGRACVVALAAAADAEPLLSRPGNALPSERHAGRMNGRHTSPAGAGRWRCCCGLLREEEHSRGRALMGWVGSSHRDWVDRRHAGVAADAVAAAAADLVACPRRRRDCGTWLAVLVRGGGRLVGR